MTIADIVRLPRSWYPADSVDEWGRDAHLIELLAPATSLRWDVAVGGLHVMTGVVVDLVGA